MHVEIFKSIYHISSHWYTGNTCVIVQRSLCRCNLIITIRRRRRCCHMFMMTVQYTRIIAYTHTHHIEPAAIISKQIHEINNHKISIYIHKRSAFSLLPSTSTTNSFTHSVLDDELPRKVFLPFIFIYSLVWYFTALPFITLICTQSHNI